MKNFPHQFNDLEKLLKALSIAKKLVDKNIPLTDENFGEQLTREGIYSYRERNLSIDQFLEKEKQKPKSNQGHLTVSRDIRRFLELLDFIVVLDDDKNCRLTTPGKQLLSTTTIEQQHQLWKNALLQMGLEGIDKEISHPYRILLKIVNTFPGIETPKLMLALEAKNDSEKEFERISSLINLSIDEILRRTATSSSMAANAVKILPGIAEQLKDIERIANKAYPVGHIVVTEDDISTDEELNITKPRATVREVASGDIARDPLINVISSVSIDISDAIKIRQKRLAEHQEIVRLLAILNEKCGFKLFVGKFDCLSIKGNKALLYEVKTILESFVDKEKQTIKGVGQLKYYKFIITEQNLGLSDIKEILVFSKKPDSSIINFCASENIAVIWKENNSFKIFNIQKNCDDNFVPDVLL